MLYDFLDGAALLMMLGLLMVAGLLIRRTLLYRVGATLHCAARIAPFRSSRGWRLGVVRYTATHLQWFRLFSFAPGPALALVRRELEVVGRREPRGSELHAVAHGAVVTTCVGRDASGAEVRVEFAFSDGVLTGFLAWLESSPPGAHRKRQRRPV